MTDKIKYPWLAVGNDGLVDNIEDNKDLARKSMSEDGFLAYAEPFEPIKITKAQAEIVKYDANCQYSLSMLIQDLQQYLSDKDIAFLFLHRNNWRDFVEIEPEKKYYLISRDLENIGQNKNKYFNIDKSGVIAPIFSDNNEVDNFQTQFTQAEIDKLGDKVSGLRKEEVK
ncbi:hypothetical protein ATX23_09450 [Oenococcus oeni]|uniref:hypothetical protein n=1 Tax=Oenococcus oeni TaxID=1247 RepID=UPI0008F87E0E|nr:hypothetical protein [Oenococcus oeni]OIL58322.1 hypothetical protein ATX23_09450 [Oenococcus oeni]